MTDTLGTRNHLNLPILGVNYAENTSKQPKITKIRHFLATYKTGVEIFFFGGGEFEKLTKLSPFNVP